METTMSSCWKDWNKDFKTNLCLLSVPFPLMLACCCSMTSLTAWNCTFLSGSLGTGWIWCACGLFCVVGFFCSSPLISLQVHELLQLRLTQSGLSSSQHQTTSPWVLCFSQHAALRSSWIGSLFLPPGIFTYIPTYLCPHISEQKVRKMLLLKEQYRFSLKMNQEVWAVSAFQFNKTLLVKRKTWIHFAKVFLKYHFFVIGILISCDTIMMKCWKCYRFHTKKWIKDQVWR